MEAGELQEESLGSYGARRRGVIWDCFFLLANSFE